MAASWYLAPSLVQLRSEINQRWPNRNKASDGSIGDPRHQAAGSGSDHNPNARRSVNAIDVTNAGIDVELLIARCIADYRTNYVISKRRILSRSKGFVPRAYFGPNAHNVHVHVSILQNRTAEDSRSNWGLASGAASGGGSSNTKPGLPTTGDGPTVTPPPTTPKEDTLSAAEVDRIISFIDTKINASNQLVAGRPALNRAGQTAADYVAKQGFDRVIIERNAEAAARQTAAIMDGRIAALSKLLEDIRREGKLTTEAVSNLDKSAADAAGKAAGENARKGITEGLSEVTATWDAALREILSELLHDFGKDSNDDQLIERVMAELAARVSPEAVAK